MLEKGRPGQVYNIGGDNEQTNITIVEQLCDQLDNRVPTKQSYRELITFVKDRPGHDRRYAIDSSKIQRELGWEPKYDFETGLKLTVDWYLEHRDWCERIRSGEYQSYYKRQYG